MLTDKELNLFKLCEIPSSEAQSWVLRVSNAELEEGDFCSIGQTCELGGDTNELFIYHHSDGGYYLVQCLEATT